MLVSLQRSVVLTVKENVYFNGTRVQRVVAVTEYLPGTKVASEGVISLDGNKLPVKRIKGRWFLCGDLDVSHNTRVALGYKSPSK